MPSLSWTQKERSLQRHHPWVFEGSIDRGRADAGETVRVEAHDGTLTLRNPLKGEHGARFVIALPVPETEEE